MASRWHTPMATASQVKPRQQPTAKTDFVKLSSEDEKAKARRRRECLSLFLFVARVRFGLAFGRSKAFEAFEGAPLRTSGRW